MDISSKFIINFQKFVCIIIYPRIWNKSWNNTETTKLIDVSAKPIIVQKEVNSKPKA